MKITEEKVVSIAYTAKKENINGEVVDQTGHDNPLRFIFGKGQLLPAFESNLNGLKKGDIFEFHLEPEQAYGKIQEDAIGTVPLSIFNNDKEMLFVGNIVNLRDQSGHVHRGKITDIEESNVIIDFNHPMAGIGMHFNGEVVEVRDATKEELDALTQTNSCNCGCDCSEEKANDCGCSDESCGCN